MYIILYQLYQNMEVWTLGHIKDAILNNVSDGLQGDVNAPIPEEQIRSEIILLRNALTVAGFTAEKGVSARMPERSDLDQHIGCLEVKEGHSSACCEVTEDDDQPVVMVPQILSVGDTPLISWLGPANKRGFSWKVYYGEGHKAKQYLPSGKRPYGVLYPPKDGYQALYLYNLPVGTTKISTSAVYTDPYAIYEFSCCSVSGFGEVEDVVALAAPDSMIAEIVNKLSQAYINYYRQMNIPIMPNDQTDKNT